MIAGPATALRHPRLYARAVALAWRLHAWPIGRVVEWVSQTGWMGLPAEYAADPAVTAATLCRMLTPLTLPGARRCLVRALLLYALLRQGRPTLRVLLGFRPGQRGALDGHAWAALGDVPLCPDDALAPQAYELIVELIGARR